MRQLLLTFITLMCCLTVSAYDFMEGGIAYNINGNGTGTTVTVTYTQYGNNYPGVTSLVIPEKVFHASKQYAVTAIGAYALYECEALTTLSMPLTVTDVGDYAAFGCEKLSALTIGSNVATIGQYAFSETALTTVELPLSVEDIGNYAFANCKKMTSLNTGNGLEYIGRSAFYKCTLLENATLGVKVNTIGTSAFAGCSLLSTLNVNMPDPTQVTVTTSSFEGVNKATCRLCVPHGSLDAYLSAPVWQDFLNISDTNQGYSLQMDFEQEGYSRIAKLEIGLANEEPVTALQLDIVLPQGMSIEMVGNNYAIEINKDRRGRDHNVAVNNTGTDTYTILLSSPSGKTFKGNTGTLMTIYLNINDMVAGYYYINARNASIAKPTSEMIYLNDMSLQINIMRRYLLGDANGDGVVDAADYVVTANKLVHKPVVAFYDDAADVNRNGGIDIGDLVGIIQRALGRITPEVIVIN